MLQKPLVIILCLAIAPPALGEDFQLLVFGGETFGDSVQLFPSLNKPSCYLEPLPENITDRPLGGLLEGKFTVCGDINHCYYANVLNAELHWSKSFELYMAQSSLITTYDNNIWSFMGRQFYEDYIFTWAKGEDKFVRKELDFYLSKSACSSRKNQSHAIFSMGRKETIFWYQEDGFQFQNWEDPGPKFSNTGCGTVLHPELGYQFVITGGIIYIDGSLETGRLGTDIFDFESGLWSEGQKLPKKISRATSVPLQNEFLLVGGYSPPDQRYTSIYKYDNEQGWVELSIKLKSPDSKVGAARVPKGMLKCP